MKNFIITTLLIACVKIGFGSDSFYSLPQTLAEAKTAGWSKVERAAIGPLPTLPLYCPDTSRVHCILFDDNNYTAGLQIALSQDNFTDRTTQGYTEWAPAVSSGDVVKYYIAFMLFISEDELATPAALRLANRVDSKVSQFGAMSMVGFDGNITRVPENASGLDAANFTKQALIPSLGVQFYHNMTENTTCTPGTILSPFGLTQSQFGLTAVGKPSANRGRDIFKRAEESAVRSMVTKVGTCFYDLAVDFGIYSASIYFESHHS